MRPNPIFALIAAAALCRPACAAPGDPPLLKSFQAPPASARPHTWWHWMNGNVTKAGITADLEAMKRAGIGGAQIITVDVGIPKGTVAIMSPQWRDAITWSVQEAHRLGLEICMANCPGWSSSGGPWVTPENGMQVLTWSEMRLAGGTRFSGVLPNPPSKLNTYRDIAVLAVRAPSPSAGGGPVPGDLVSKADFSGDRPISPNPGLTPAGMATPHDAVIVVDDRPDGSGKVSWTAPAGDWTLLRLGYTPNGMTNHPAPADGLGLECDKLSRAAMDQNWNGMMAPVLKDAGALAGITLNNSLIDSYEVGSQNWTPKFREEFRARRGYDPVTFLPIVTGRVIDSSAVSERFLWDMRKTIADLFTDNYFGYFDELCRKNHLLSSIEPYGDGPFDNLQVGTKAAIPMGEFWIGGAAIETTKLAASAAHISGKHVIGAESFTADDQHAKWTADPYSIKTLGDRAFAMGINRYIFHRYAHQPWLNLKPGMTMGPYGMNLERTLTWWDQGAAWLRYVARCQYMLQSGRFAADVLVYSGENQTNPIQPPFGFDYDGCDVSILEQARVQNHEIVLPTGMRYRLLVLPDTNLMTPKVAGIVRDLAAAGAAVYGPRPTASPSLVGYPGCDASVRAISDEVWGSGDAGAPALHAYGLGHVASGRTLDATLAALRITPDVILEGGRRNTIAWIHRTAPGSDTYFVSNQKTRAQSVVISFRTAGREPELWHPETGRTERAPVWRQRGGRTEVSLQLEPAESVFVVFRSAPGAGGIVSITPPHRGSEPTAPRVEIQQAFYEAVDGAGRADVTAKVAEMVARGETTIDANNGNFGDPASLHVKRLRVIYRVNGKQMEASTDENTALDIGPPDTTPGLPAYTVAGTAVGPVINAWAPGVYRVALAGGRVTNLRSPGAMKRSVGGPWRLTFPPGLGAPTAVTLPDLISWSEHTDPGVRYFSGSAVYDTRFNLGGGQALSGRTIYLDLGTVKNFAEVRINGTRMRTLWKPPFRLDITPFARAGENTLSIRVTNLWPNRLIGDEFLPDDAKFNGDAIAEWPQWLLDNQPRPNTGRVTFTTWKLWRKDSKLLESGLIGPVNVIAVPRLMVGATPAESTKHRLPRRSALRAAR